MTDTQALRELARLIGVQTAYHDASGKRRQASRASILMVLQQLGAPLARLNDAAEALRAEREKRAHAACAPVTALWQGTSAVVGIQLPRSNSTSIECRLLYEGGEVRTWAVRPQDLDRAGPADAACHSVALKLPVPLPFGYHRLQLEAPRFACETLVLSAPRKAFHSPEKLWGIFVPPYALRSGSDWGAGSFSDLDATASWMCELGGRVVATLPMLAAFLDEPYDPSPYAPVSRLFWNEFYVDVTRVPELARCEEARILCESQALQSEVAALRLLPEVDYRHVMHLKRRVLALLAKEFFARPSERHQDFAAYLRDHPAVLDYAAFRAVHDRFKAPWHKWPERQHAGTLSESDYDAAARNYHLYAQWLAHEQVHELGRKMRDAGARLYLDLPLGTHPDGYDVWRRRDLFVRGLSTGAPPDPVFTQGQNWGFPPLHPGQMRTQKYRHFRDVLRHHLRSAGILRIDHVMSLHRLFCIPAGLDPGHGVYLRYPADELYAMLAIESHRHRATIVGENLGTVPAYVDADMSRRGLKGMYVVQYTLAPSSPCVLSPVAGNSVASLNTHDMPTFAAYWEGLDIAQRKELGLLDAAGTAREQKQRRQLCTAVTEFLVQQHWLNPDEREALPAVLAACLAFLSASRGFLTLISLEDLWLEKQPQNIPGTGPEMSNWRRKMRYSHAKFSQMPSVLNCLKRVAALRKTRETANG